jgi:hypothetical protein
MKVAMLYGGEPRFKRYLPLNYTRLENFSKIDLYFCLWQDYEYNDMNLNFSVIEDGNIITRIQSCLPKNVHLKNLIEIPKPDISEKSKKIKSDMLFSNIHYFLPDIDNYVERLLYQKNALYECFRLIREEYDCIIRYRIDGYPTEKIDLKKLNLNDFVYTPRNMRQGVSDIYPKINDQFAIGNFYNMKIYFDNYNNIGKYVEKDPKNGQFETCLSCHLIENDIKIKHSEFGYHLIKEHTGFILNE